MVTTLDIPASVTATHRLSSTDELGTRGSLDVRSYSLMKHGDVAAVRRLALPLAEKLLREVPELLTQRDAPLFAVAFKAVRPSCWYLTEAIADVVSSARSAHGLDPARVIHVLKATVTSTDYALASATERAAELGSIGFELQDDVEGARVVVVDDVRVTGAAERIMLDVLAAGRPGAIHLAYVAVVDGTLATTPAVESVLNTASVRGVADLVPVVRRGDFVLTIRFLKGLLAAPAPERREFLAACPASLLTEMLDGATATGVAFASRHAQALAEVATAADIR